MQRRDGQLIVSATDLVGFLECGHLTLLDRAMVAGLVAKPDRGDDPALELLRWRGGEHEKRYIALLRESNRKITDLSGNDGLSYQERAAATEEAMRRGDDVIYQATVFDGRWVGHPDFLLRVPGASGLGDWHYEVADTKLAHVAKASALIQIASYVEQIERIQGVRPERVYVVTGGAVIDVKPFRTADMMAYFRRAKARFEAVLAEELDMKSSYPDPVEHCAVCRWYYAECRPTWRRDDALPIVANISRKQRTELRMLGIDTRRGLARSDVQGFDVVKEQARLQAESEDAGVLKWELLDGSREVNRGLSALPPPSEFDLFFDFEGDPFAFWEGLEYLFGIWDGAVYRPFWAMNRTEEKEQFMTVMDWFHSHWREHPQMHIYHYGAYEPSRLKTLAGRHATRQDELDELLTAEVFVDLYRVVRQGVRVGSERYSIKNLEPLYGFTRTIELRDANSSIVEFEKMLEIGDPSGELQALIAGYNRDDCVSTEKLRDWLEERRFDAARQFGGELPRPRVAVAKEEKEPTDWEVRLAGATDRLSPDPDNQLLINLLDWHRREEKASWWRFFELLTLSDDDLFNEPEPIGRLRYEGVLGETKGGKVVHRYSFDAQEHKVGNRSQLYNPHLQGFDGKLGGHKIDKDNLTLDITQPPEWDGRSLTSVVPKDRIPKEAQQDSLLRVADWVAEQGIASEHGGYRAVRDLLLRHAPRVAGREGAVRDGEPGREKALRLAPLLDATTLAIQGPPGSGKTTTGTQMILELVAAGRRVGITGPSHKVVSNLLIKVCWAAERSGVSLKALQKCDGEDGTDHPLVTLTKDNGKHDKLMADEAYRVIAGTTWLWAREQMAGSVDTLFVDEAGQVALANVVAAGGAARNIVLLGDPQQLDQVLQGSHPPGAEKSALGHFLADAKVIDARQGVFLEKTHRMHPAITAFTSQQFYEGDLGSDAGLEAQRVLGSDELAGSGLRWVGVVHDGNTNASLEEAREVARIVRLLVGREWVNRDGERAALRGRDIVIVSPFNAHRLLVGAELARLGLVDDTPLVGTVDKFQGQEAPISVFTMATSRPEDAPRGLDFLFSLNRLNVATSRARALAIVVASPRLLDAVAHSPDQLRMVNALGAALEMATDSQQEHTHQVGPRRP